MLKLDPSVLSKLTAMRSSLGQLPNHDVPRDEPESVKPTIPLTETLKKALGFTALQSGTVSRLIPKESITHEVSVASPTNIFLEVIEVENEQSLRDAALSVFEHQPRSSILDKLTSWLKRAA